MVRRYFKTLAICLVCVASQMPLVSALSDAQSQVFNRGILYFNAEGASNTCAADTASSAAGPSNNSATLSGIAAKYGLQSAVIEKLGGGVVDSFQAEQPPNTPASTMKLIIADVVIRSGLDLGQKVAVSGEEVYPGDPSYPKPTTILLSDALNKMLTASSNTAANALMKGLGGVGAFTQKARGFGYTHTNVVGYYFPQNDSKNSSTIQDEADAMNHIFSSSGGDYTAVQNYLVQAAKSDNEYRVTDDANKWAGTSTVAGNVGKVNVAGQDYIIGIYKNINDSSQNFTTPSIMADIKNGFNDAANSIAAQNSGPNNADSSVQTAQTSNTDYAGRAILNQGMLKALADNTPTYQQAASQVGISWQVLAALHYREHSLLLTEPDNGQGVYQIVSNDKHTAGAYPAAGTTLTAAQFLAQSLDAANFIKADGAGLSDKSDPATIKDAFVKYNGEPQKYIDQAVALGYSSAQGYEGSPYVMNIADLPRDPTSGPLSNWLQDQGGGNYQPASKYSYGAYVVFSSISGQTITGGCASSPSCSGGANNLDPSLSPVRQNVVCIAQAELGKWQGHQLNPGSGYLTYSQDVPQDWCADFVSWVYDQAQYPLKSDPSWRVPRVEDIKTIGLQDQSFHWHAKSGYIPKPGDIAIHNDGASNYHANIVVGVNGNQVTQIGGNQGGNDFNQSNVSKDSLSDDIAGYVTPD